MQLVWLEITQNSEDDGMNIQVRLLLNKSWIHAATLYNLSNCTLLQNNNKGLKHL